MAQQLSLDELSTVFAGIQGLLLTEEGLQASVHSRDVANRACVVPMERLGLSHEAALHRLVKQARDDNTALQQISKGVIAGTPAPGA